MTAAHRPDMVEVRVSIPRAERNRIGYVVESGLYVSRAEFIRSAIREKLSTFFATEEATE